MAEVDLPHDFRPRVYQLPFMSWFDNGGKRAVWVMHRRGGKDLTAMHQTCKMAHERIGAYWHIFPTAEQGRKAIWEGFTKEGKRIMEQVFPAEIRKSPTAFLPKAEMVVELECGSIWRLLGSDKIQLVGAGPVGVVFSEYATAKPSAWNLIRPMLRENEGWAAFITTPRGNNHAKKLFDMAGKEPGWFRELLTLEDTRAYDPQATMAAERAEGMPEALIRQEYLCDWTAANVGSVFGDLVEQLEHGGGVKEFDHPSDGVYTSWDLGHTDATGIWFWRINESRCVDVIDHYEAHGKPMSHYFDVVDSKGFSYVKHCLPHDARAKTLQTGASIQDQAMQHWPGKVIIVPNLSVADGIQAGRWLLQQPIRIHSRCGEGVEALRQYHYQYDEDTRAFSVKPEHDWSSHTADAFRYLALVVKYGELVTRPAPKAPPLNVRGHDHTWTLDQLFKDNEQSVGRRRI